MPIIKLKNLTKSFGENIILNGITVDIDRGEIVSIIGPSETAKNTFLRCINLLETPSGNVIIDGQDLLNPATNVLKVRQKIGMVFKNFNLYSHLTVIENITLAPRTLLKTSKKKAFNEAMQLLQNFGLSSKAYAFPSELSSWEKQRVAILRAIIMKPDILLLDEPTLELNTTMIGEMLAIIKKLAQSDVAVVIVTGDMKFAKAVSTRVLYVDEGCIYEEGTVRDIFERPKQEKTKAFVEKISVLSRTLSPENVDISKLNEDIANFCFENFVNKQKVYNVQLIVEELLWNILFPSFAEKNNKLEFNFSINHKHELISMTFTYAGKPYDICLNENTVMSQKIIERKAQSIDNTVDENGLNKLIVKVNTNDFVIPLQYLLKYSEFFD